MKKSVIILLIIGVIPLSLHARGGHYYYNSTPLHYFSLHVDGGYGHLFTSYDDLQTRGNVSASLGFGYEYRYASFWFATGIDGQLLNSTSLLQAKATEGPKTLLFAAEDTEGTPMVMRYRIDHLDEVDQLVALSLPLLIGYHHPSGLYVGGGVKLGYGIYADATSHLTYTTSGQYEQLAENMTDMSGHAFRTYSMTGKNNLKTGFRATVCLEGGYDLLSQASDQSSFCRVLKLGAFVECGVNSPFSTIPSYTSLLLPHTDAAQEVDVRSLYNIVPTTAYTAIPFRAGIKLTALFRMSTKKSRCNCH